MSSRISHVFLTQLTDVNIREKYPRLIIPAACQLKWQPGRLSELAFQDGFVGDAFTNVRVRCGTLTGIK